MQLFFQFLSSSLWTIKPRKLDREWRGRENGAETKELQQLNFLFVIFDNQAIQKKTSFCANSMSDFYQIFTKYVIYIINVIFIVNRPHYF